MPDVEMCEIVYAEQWCENPAKVEIVSGGDFVVALSCHQCSDVALERFTEVKQYRPVTKRLIK